MTIPHWHRDTAPTAPTPVTSGTRTGRSQAALLFGDKPSVFGRPPTPQGQVAPGAPADRQIENWQHVDRAITAGGPIALRGRRRRR